MEMAVETKLQNNRDALLRFPNGLVCFALVARGPDGNVVADQQSRGGLALPEAPASAAQSLITQAQDFWRATFAGVAPQLSISIVKAPPLFPGVYRTVFLCEGPLFRCPDGFAFTSAGFAMAAGVPLEQLASHALSPHTIGRPRVDDEPLDNNKLARTRQILESVPVPPLLTVDGILLNEAGAVVLERRSHRLSREPGKWAFPAGFVDANESLGTALVREVREELGLTLDPADLLGCHEILCTEDRDPVWYTWTTTLVARVTGRLPSYGPTDEVEDIQPFPLAALPRWEECAFDHCARLQRFREVARDFLTEATRRAPTV